MGGSLRIFERQVLVFPLLVVFLACLSFLFGGRCAVWEWWTAAAAVVAVPFVHRSGWRTALGAAGLFAGCLVVVKGVLPPLAWDNAGCVDMGVYHLPMIRLLAEGWNPVADPLAEGITSRLGLDLWGMAPLHVAFLPRTLAVLAAVACPFTGDPTGLTLPVLAFLWIGVALPTVRRFRGPVRWVVLAALAWVLPKVDYRMYVDVSLAFASCGLLFAMDDALAGREFDWLRLGVWTTWMGTIKLNGVLALAVFWCLFAGAVLWRERSCRAVWLGRFAALTVAVSAIAAVVLWSPFGTSWRTYGHPLYPFRTVDAERYPVRDLTWDMRVANQDYKALGRAGLWVHHFVSPRLAAAWGRRATGQAEFHPASIWFSGQYVRGAVRPRLWFLFALLFLHPRGRLWGGGGLLLTALVPWEAIGFLRYQPWLTGLGCLAVALAAESASARWGNKAGRLPGVVFPVVLVLACGTWMWRHARDVEFKAAECSCVRDRIHATFWPSGRSPADGVDPDDFTPRYAFLRAMENQCLLLVQEMGWEGMTQVLTAAGWTPPADGTLVRRPLWQFDERAWFRPEDEKDKRVVEDLGQPWATGSTWKGFGVPPGVEPWVETPWHLYWVPLGDRTEHVLAYHGVAGVSPVGTCVAMPGRSPAAVLRTWFVTYPGEVARWLAGSKTEASRRKPGTAPSAPDQTAVSGLPPADGPESSRCRGG